MNQRCIEADRLPAWCAVRAKPGGEYLARTEMARVGIESYLPEFKREYRHHRSKRWIVRHFPLFVGYIFTPLLRLNREALNDCDGLAREGVLRGPDGMPLRISGRAIQALRENEAKGLFDQLKTRGHRLAPGQMVRVLEGPFLGFDAIIGSVKDSTNVNLLLSMFGRPTTVRTSVDKIEVAA